MLKHTKRQDSIVKFLDHALSICGVCNRCLFTFPFEIEMAEEQQGILTSLKEIGGLNSFISPTAPSPLRYRRHEKLNRALISFFFFSCTVFLTELPNSEADSHVLVSKCSDMEKMEGDKKCAHDFLKKIRNPSANCRFCQHTVFMMSYFIS